MDMEVSLEHSSSSVTMNKTFVEEKAAQNNGELVELYLSENVERV